MSCLLVCGTINDPNHIKTGVKTAAGNQKQSSSNVLEKYFIVKNKDYVRVKYVLVYVKKAS